MNASGERRPNWIIGLWVCIALGFGVMVWLRSLYPIDMHKLRRLPLGTTQTEVLRIFGPPKGTSVVSNETWYQYYSKGHSTIVYIILDSQKGYKGYELDDD